MATGNILWNYSKKLFTFGLIGLTVSDSFASVSVVRGASMSPTFNPSTSSLMGLTAGKLCFGDFKECLPSFLYVLLTD